MTVETAFALHLPNVTTITLAIALGAVPTLCEAGQANLRPVEVSDRALERLRGRFVSAGRVFEFGVEMVSRWQTSAGEVLSAAAHLRVDLASNRPIVSFEPHLTIVEAGSATPNPMTDSFASGAEGTERVAGVAQVIQVAGDRNSVRNQATLLVTDRPVAGHPAATPSGPVEQVRTSASGSTVSATLGADVMAVAIHAPGGMVTQKIRGMNGEGVRGASGMVQRVQVSGDLHHIHNMLNVRVHTGPQPAATMPIASMRESLSTLHRLRPAGLF